MSVEITPGADGVTITLGDGDAGNLLTLEEVTAITTAIGEADRSDARWVLLHHRGADFCLGRAPGKLGDVERRVLLGLVEALRSVDIPVVTAASGGCEGFGAGLFALGDIALLTDGAWLRFPEILRGSAPAIVATWLFDLVPPKLATYWIATATRIDPPTALTHGLATGIAGDLDTEIARELGRLGELDPLAVRRCKTVGRVMRQAPQDPIARRDIALRFFG
jgi:enoyl-CoA hydratase